MHNLRANWLSLDRTSTKSSQTEKAIISFALITRKKIESPIRSHFSLHKNNLRGITLSTYKTYIVYFFFWVRISESAHPIAGVLGASPTSPTRVCVGGLLSFSLTKKVGLSGISVMHPAKAVESKTNGKGTRVQTAYQPFWSSMLQKFLISKVCAFCTENNECHDTHYIFCIMWGTIPVGK